MKGTFTYNLHFSRSFQLWEAPRATGSRDFNKEGLSDLAPPDEVRQVPTPSRSPRTAEKILPSRVSPWAPESLLPLRLESHCCPLFLQCQIALIFRASWSGSFPYMHVALDKGIPAG